MTSCAQGADRADAGRRYCLYFCLSIAFVLIIRPDNPGLVMSGLLDDCDSFMRLVRMQEALDLGHWFGDGVARGESGHGLALSWAHVMDALILALRAPLRLVMDPAPALFWAGVATAPLAMGLLGMLCAWAAAPMAARGWLWTAPIAAIGAPPILNYGQLGFVTHHILILVCVVGAWGSACRAALGWQQAGTLTGVFVAIGIWVSPEAMPYGMGAIGLIAIAWFVDRAPRIAGSLAGAGTGLLAVLAAAFLIDPPHDGYATVELDRLSVSFLCLGMIVGVVCWLPRAFGWSGWRLMCGGAVGATAWLALFPSYLHGLASLMTPEEAAAFFGHIQEMKPLDTPGTIVLSAMGGTLAMVGAAALTCLARSARQRWLWGYTALWIATALALAVVHQRFSAYPAAAAAIVLPVLLTRVSHSASRRACAVLRPALLGAFCCAPALLGQALVSHAEAQQIADRKEAEARCPVQSATAILAPFPGSIVLTNVVDGPEILYRTKVKIVGSLYHRGIAGYMRLQAAWAAPAGDDVPPAVAATEAEYVLTCAGHATQPLVTLDRRLRGDTPPAWLQQVAREPASGWTLYRIVPPSR